MQVGGLCRPDGVDVVRRGCCTLLLHTQPHSAPRQDWRPSQTDHAAMRSPPTPEISGGFSQESKIGEADAPGALDGFWPDPDGEGCSGPRADIVTPLTPRALQTRASGERTPSRHVFLGDEGALCITLCHEENPLA